MECIGARNFATMAVSTRPTWKPRRKRLINMKIKPVNSDISPLRLIVIRCSSGNESSCVAVKEEFADEEDYVKAGGSELLFVQMQQNKGMDSQSKLSDKLPQIPTGDSLLDLVVIGCGPAGLALAAESAKLGLTVGLIGPDLPFTNNYGVWEDEFIDLGLEGCIEHVWRDTIVYLNDSDPIMIGRAYGRVSRHLLHEELLKRCVESGVSYLSSKVDRIIEASNDQSLVECENNIVIPCRLATVASGAASGKLLQYEVGGPRVSVQTAYGVEVEVENNPYDPSLMVFMDYRDYIKQKFQSLEAQYPTFLYAMPHRNAHIIHEMRKLSDQEAWELFNAKVRLPIQLEKLGIELVRKCMGYPLRILALGDILSRRAVTEDQWMKVLNQVLDQNQELVFNELEVAVDSLPSHLKDCLSSFELFNDDFDIPMRRLIVYWVAEGHVQQEGGSGEPPEILAEKQLMEFIQQNMIQVVKWKINGRVKTCRMNYFLRDNWLPKVKKEKSVYNKTKDATFKLSYFLNVNHKEASSKSSSCTGMILRLADQLDNKEKCFSHIHGNQKISHSSFKKYYGDLCSLVSFDSREGPVPGEAIGNFLRRGIAGRCFKILRVLDLEGVFRPNLPELIRKLLQLRYLGLRRTYIEGLPSTIGKLLNLQTLDLKHTCIRSLPCSVWEMKQLRHIYLSESYRSRIVAPPRTSSLVDFQTLWGAFVDEETPVADGLDRLINLRKLGLVCRLITSQQKELAEWISKLEHLESLRLRSINEMVRPSNLYLKSLSSMYNLSSIYLLGRLENPEFMNVLPTSLTEITLSSSELVEDPMKKLEKLPNLRILNLYAGSYTGKTMVCSSWGFPLLRVLNLWKLEELEEWTVEEGALAILRDLEIRSCNKFKKIPDGLIHLGGCRELKLTNMADEFKARVIANQGQDWYKIAHVPSVIIKN